MKRYLVKYKLPGIGIRTYKFGYRYNSIFPYAITQSLLDMSYNHFRYIRKL